MIFYSFYDKIVDMSLFFSHIMNYIIEFLMSRDSHSDGKFEFSEAMKNTSQRILPNEQERFIKNRGALEFK